MSRAGVVSEVLLSRPSAFVPGLDGPGALSGDGQFRGRVLVVQRETGLRLAATGEVAERDTRTATAILARDTQAITSDAACGCQALRGLLRPTAECDMHVELLRLATSADAGADPARVVGYGAFMLTP